MAKQQSSKEKKRLLGLYLQNKDMEFDACKEEYSHKNPPPEKEKVYPTIQFWMGAFSALAAGVTSGFRVYDRLYSVAYASSGNVSLAVGEALAAVGAVNIAIISMAFVIAYKNNKHSSATLKWGLFVAIAISAVAGLGQSFKGLDMLAVTEGFDWVLAIILAGITALEYLSGDIMGVEWVAYKKKKIETAASYAKENKQWETQVRRVFGSWKSNYVRWENKELGIRAEESLEQVPEPEQKPKKNKKRTKTQKQFIKGLVQKLFDETNSVPSFSDVVELFAETQEINERDFDGFQKSKKSSVSGARSEWMFENGFEE